MPVTTYLQNEPPVHKDKDLADMIAELSTKSKEKWSVMTNYVYKKGKRWYNSPVKIEQTSLYKQLSPCGEYQILTCVSTIKEAKIYLYGALGQIDKIERE